jgi:hypothetical protein
MAAMGNGEPLVCSEDLTLPALVSARASVGLVGGDTVRFV